MWVIVVTLLAALASQTGFFLWKLSASELNGLNPRKPLLTLGKLLSNRLWLGGYISATLGWILFIYATNIGSLSIVQPLMSVGDLYLVLLAFFVLGERLNFLEWWGLALTIFGAALLATTITTLPPVVLNWGDVFKFFVLSFAGVGGLYGLRSYLRSREVMLAVIAGITFGSASIATKLMTIYINKFSAHPSAYDFVFNPILPVVILLNIAGIIVLQLAFQKGRACVVVPIQLAVMNALAILAGVTLFNEIVTITHGISVLLITSGALLMNYASKPIDKVVAKTSA